MVEVAKATAAKSKLWTKCSDTVQMNELCDSTSSKEIHDSDNIAGQRQRQRGTARSAEKVYSTVQMGKVAWVGTLAARDKVP